MLKKIFFYSCFFLRSFIPAQEKKIDSLYQLLSKNSKDSIYLSSHNKLGDYFSKENHDSAIYHYKTSLKKSLELKSYYHAANNYYDLGVLFVKIGEVDSGIAYYSNGLNHLQGENSEGYINLMSGLGNAWFVKGNFIKSYEYFLNYLKEAERKGSPRQLARACSNVGAILKEQKKLDEAIPYFLRSIKLYEQSSEPKGAYIAYVNLGNVYYEKSHRTQIDSLRRKALYYYDLARPVINYKDEYKMRVTAITLLCNLGNIYADLNNYGQSEKEYKNAIALIDEGEYFPQAALVYNNMADMYVGIKDLTKAREALKKAEYYTKRTDSPDNYNQLYQVYSNYYELLGDYKKAFEYHVLFKKYSDSLYNSDNSERRKELELNYEFDKKEAAAKAEQEKKEAIAEQEKKRQRLILYSVFAGFALMALLSFFIYKGYRTKKKANEIIIRQKEEVEKAKVIIEKQKEIVEEKQKEVLDSIHYAKRIQDALFAGSSVMESNLKDDYFIYFKPKDIVSGDFYWATEQGDHFFLAVCDSTGHGVPGAFMSLLNIGFMSEAINEKNILKPDEIFNYVRKRLINSISKEGQKDGFDGILLCFDKKTRTATYAAANNRPVLVSNNEFLELPADRMPVGIGERSQNFTLHTFDIVEGDTLYLYTDGYADQFGGEKGKKFKYKPLNELLTKNSKLNIRKQKEELAYAFEHWKSDLEQVDDVLVVGIKI